MSRYGPLYAALILFPLLAAGAVLPYVALQYRRRGTIGVGHLVLAGAFALYLVGLAFTVIVPLRPVTPDFCTLYGVDPQFTPSILLNEFQGARAQGGWAGLLGNAKFQGTVLNIFLFVPLGLFVRHMFDRGVRATVAIGFGVSMAIELTQLTGNWGLYPCSYRFFETLDIATNVAGVAIGAICAPLLRLVPAQRGLVPAASPQPVTWQRRLLAAACNAAAITLLGLLLLALAAALLELTRGQLFDSDSLSAHALRALALVLIPGTALLLVVPLAWKGRTPGEWAVLIEPATIGAGATPPPWFAIVARFLAGPAPMLIAAAAALAGITLAWLALAVAALVHTALLVRARRWRDGVELRSGMRLIDSR